MDSRHWGSKGGLYGPALFKPRSNRASAYSNPASPLSNGTRFSVVIKQLRIVGAAARNWCRKCLLYTPTLLRLSINKNANRDANSSRPFCHAHRFSVVSKQFITALVLELLCLRCPTTIARFVVAIIVWVTIQGRALRTSTHVIQKTSEGRAPSFMHCDSSSPVAMVVISVRIIAPLYHSLPRLILRCYRIYASSAVLDRLAFSHLKLLHSFMVVRAESVVMDRIGSFHCINSGRQVQHI